MTSLQLYTVSSADFSVHLKLGNYRPGFLNGSIYQHAPIFWSKLFFYDVPAENGRNWSSRIVLLNGPNELKDYACGGKTMEIKGQRLLGNKQEGGAMYLMSVLEQAHFINPIASAGEG